MNDDIYNLDRLALRRYTSQVDLSSFKVKSSFRRTLQKLAYDFIKANRYKNIPRRLRRRLQRRFNARFRKRQR